MSILCCSSFEFSGILLQNPNSILQSCSPIFLHDTHHHQPNPTLPHMWRDASSCRVVQCSIGCFLIMIYPSLAATFPSKSSRLGFHQGGIMVGHRSLGSRQVRKGYTNCFLEESFDLNWLLNKITAFLWSWYVGSFIEYLESVIFVDCF